MIPKPFIARWKDHAPWSSFDQIEQDLVISRALVAIFSDDFLKENLAFRGGTSLHKLYLHPAPRYSEDIDLVQIKEGPIKPVLQRLDHVLTFFEESRIVKQKAQNNTILYRFQSEYTPNRKLRLKTEINCREHFSVFGFQQFPFAIDSEWFSGKAEITTYDIHELLGTKLRALYQRKKGRDLFDLYYADRHTSLDHEKILEAYRQYMRFSVEIPPSQKLFLQNMEEKQKDPAFLGDLEGLLRPGIVFDPEEAFEWVKESIIAKLG